MKKLLLFLLIFGFNSFTQVSYYIPSGSTVEFTTDQLNIIDLTVESGATMILWPNVTFGIQGNYINNGNFNPSGSNFVFNGGSDQTISGSNLSFDDVDFQSMGNISVGGNITVSGNMRLLTGLFDLGSRTISGTGNFSLNGATLKFSAAGGINDAVTTPSTYYSDDSGFEFSGSAPQVTGDNFPSLVKNLTVNNPTGLTLSGATEVSSNLNFWSGNITLGANDLVLGGSVSVNGSVGTDKMIVATGTGKLKRKFPSTGEFTFPVGDGTNYTPVILNFSAGNFDESTYANVQVTAAAHPERNSGNPNYLKRYWTIGSNVTTPVCTVSVKYGDGDIEGDESSFILGRWTGTNWEQTTFISRDISSNTLTASTTGFSDFTAGDEGALPVELSSFYATYRNGIVDLKWETKTEVNNYGFEVERKSSTSDWSKIGFVEGHGSTNSPKYYSYSDKPSGTGKISYRLKQIDNDGQFEYSSVVEVLVDNLPNGFVLEQNYPNPFNPETSIRFALKEDTKASLKVFNAMGEEVATLFDGIAEAGRYYDVKFSGNDLSSGFYIYKLVAGEYVSVKKMLLMK